MISINDSRYSVIDSHLAGVMFLAWRCLYAEIIARINKENSDMGAALERTGAMCITRLMTYGLRRVQLYWRKWSKQRI